ncbi:HlyD family secretion protein [uncultured Phascolarctobacterium sp.]|uniref:HlyD family secretion protein n=1 Tax=uncultured Phascolarctobacterium sp. TaxID=512296 RepID=UPI0025D9D13D|nr:HlyD family efflux transporter periplasmic adaptor subunit [uncultured Phascolarctobacterium sp.]
MKKLLLLCCSLLLVAGCGKPAATLPTVIGSGSVEIPVYKITAPAAGKILGLILEPNERIGQGQPLFAIEQPELDAAVEDAATEAARAEAELTNLESGSGEQAIAAANYSLQSAESSYQTASQNYQKMASLYAQNAIARIKVEQAQAALEAAKANLEAAQAHQTRLTAKASPEAIEQQKQVALQAQQHYQQLLQKQQATEAQSPCTGVVTEKLLQTGATAAQGQHILTIRATEQRQVQLKLPQQQAAALKPGQAVTAEAAALKKSFPGTVTAVANGTVTITLEDKLEELQAATEVSISLKNDASR